MFSAVEHLTFEYEDHSLSSEGQTVQNEVDDVDLLESLTPIQRQRRRRLVDSSSFLNLLPLLSIKKPAMTLVYLRVFLVDRRVWIDLKWPTAGPWAGHHESLGL